MTVEPRLTEFAVEEGAVEVELPGDDGSTAPEDPGPGSLEQAPTINEIKTIEAQLNRLDTGALVDSEALIPVPIYLIAHAVCQVSAVVLIDLYASPRTVVSRIPASTVVPLRMNEEVVPLYTATAIAVLREQLPDPATHDGAAALFVLEDHIGL